MRLLVTLLCALALAVALPSQAAADRFDVVVINHVLVKAYSDPIMSGGGISFSCGLIVNTGSAPITASDINGAHFSAVVTAGDIPWGPWRSGMGSVAAGLTSDLLPGEAVGNVNLGNDTLQTFLQPGEVLRNTAPSGSALACEFGWPKDYVGTACYNVTMTLGGQVIHFPLQADIVQVPNGQQGKQNLEVLRVQSSAPVPTVATSWGRIKSLYH